MASASKIWTCRICTKNNITSIKCMAQVIKKIVDQMSKWCPVNFKSFGQSRISGLVGWISKRFNNGENWIWSQPPRYKFVILSVQGLQREQRTGHVAGTLKRSDLKLARRNSEAATASPPNVNQPGNGRFPGCISRHNAAKSIDGDRKDYFSKRQRGSDNNFVITHLEVLVCPPDKKVQTKAALWKSSLKIGFTFQDS